MIRKLAAIALATTMSAHAQQWNGHNAVEGFQFQGHTMDAYFYDGALSDVVHYLDPGVGAGIVTNNQLLYQNTAELQQMMHEYLAVSGAGWLPGCNNDSCIVMAPVGYAGKLGDQGEDSIIFYPARVSGAGALSPWGIAFWRLTYPTVGYNRTWVIWKVRQ